MNSFIKKTIASIKKDHLDLKNISIILPNTTHIEFIKKEIGEEDLKLLKIEELFKQITKLNLIEKFSLYVDFFQIVQKKKILPLSPSMNL